jgi:hypothetical protein
MKTFVNPSQTPSGRTDRKRAHATRSPSETVDWHWADQRLDEELRDTFPASDALSVTRNPTRRMIAEGIWAWPKATRSRSRSKERDALRLAYLADSKMVFNGATRLGRLFIE